MNGPLLATIMTMAAIGFVVWYAWATIKNVSLRLAWFILIAGVVPLFFAGGWAAGYTVRNTGITFALFGFMVAGIWLKMSIQSWAISLNERNAEKHRQQSAASNDEAGV